MATVSLHFNSGSRVCIAYPPSTTMHSCTNIVPKSDHIVLLVTANVPQTLCIHKCTHFYGSPSFTLQEEYGKLVQKKQQQHCNNIPEKSLMLCQGNDDHIEVHTGNKHRKTVRHGHVEKSGCGNWSTDHLKVDRGVQCTDTVWHGRQSQGRYLPPEGRQGSPMHKHSLTWSPKSG